MKAPAETSFDSGDCIVTFGWVSEEHKIQACLLLDRKAQFNIAADAAAVEGLQGRQLYEELRLRGREAARRRGCGR